MDSDDDSFFSRNAAGAGNQPQGRNQRQKQPTTRTRQDSPNPFQADPDFDVDLNLGGEYGRGLDGEEGEETPLQQLIRHWMNERHAPDILPAQQILLAGLLDHIRRQSDVIQTLRADPSSSEEDHFRIMLVQTEIERVKFIVRSYVRTRLFKIEKYARFITLDLDTQSRMSVTELEHAKRHAELTDNHFYQSILQSLPEQQMSMDDAPAFVPAMVTEPDKSRGVFVHARVNCPPVRLPNGNIQEMEKGAILLTQYAAVEQLVARGEVELV